jgi:hypothetical protein
MIVSFLLTSTVLVSLQRFPLAANSGYGPTGMFTSTDSNGTSGRLRNGDAGFADERFAVQVYRDAIAFEDDDDFGELRVAVGDEVDGAF